MAQLPQVKSHEIANALAVQERNLSAATVLPKKSY
jgi:hypothetical protein